MKPNIETSYIMTKIIIIQSMRILSLLLLLDIVSSNHQCDLTNLMFFYINQLSIITGNLTKKKANGNVKTKIKIKTKSIRKTSTKSSCEALKSIRSDQYNMLSKCSSELRGNISLYSWVNCLCERNFKIKLTSIVLKLQHHVSMGHGTLIFPLDS